MTEALKVGQVPDRLFDGVDTAPPHVENAVLFGKAAQIISDTFAAAVQSIRADESLSESGKRDKIDAERAKVEKLLEKRWSDMVEPVAGSLESTRSGFAAVKEQDATAAVRGGEIRRKLESMQHGERIRIVNGAIEAGDRETLTALVTAPSVYGQLVPPDFMERARVALDPGRAAQIGNLERVLHGANQAREIVSDQIARLARV